MINSADCKDCNQSVIPYCGFFRHLSPLQFVEAIKCQITKAYNVNDCCEPSSQFGHVRVWNKPTSPNHSSAIIRKETIMLVFMILKVLHAPSRGVKIRHNYKVNQNHNYFETRQPLLLKKHVSLLSTVVVNCHLFLQLPVEQELFSYFKEIAPLF